MTGEQTVLAQELEAQGWVRQFTVEVERADEYVELMSRWATKCG